MQYVFFGTPDFAAVILEKLIEADFIPQAVVCNPDRPVGRKKIVTPPPVKSFILNHESRSIKVLQPEKLDSSFKSQISSFKSNFFIVAAYSKIIPKEILAIPKLGSIGVHPSLLPRLRGPTPIQTVILNGEKETGVTLYLMDEKMDHGPVLAQNMYHVARNTTYLELMEALAKVGGDLLVETIPKFLAGEIKPKSQDHERTTFTKKITIEDALISEEELKSALAGDKEMAIRIDRMIRALNPEPGSYTFKKGRRIKLLKSEVQGEKLILKEIQEEGKKPRKVDSFYE